MRPFAVAMTLRKKQRRGKNNVDFCATRRYIHIRHWHEVDIMSEQSLRNELTAMKQMADTYSEEWRDAEADLDEISQIAGRSLGCPLWNSDPQNTPRKSPEYVNVGDRTPVDLVRALAVQYDAALKRANRAEAYIRELTEEQRRIGLDLERILRKAKGEQL